MKIIVGIGNPGSRYTHNRHNIGFQLLDYFALRLNLKFSASKFDYYFAEGDIKGNPFVLIKPTTYVNNSGIAVLQSIKHYGSLNSDILVIVDDINLQVTDFRIRMSGSDGGHNGLDSIIYHLQSEEFSRIRIGVGNQFESGNLPDYVLSDFNDDEFKNLKRIFDKCTDLIEDFIGGGYQQLLNSYSIKINQEKLNKEPE